MRSEKEKQILELVEKHRWAPLQRSPAWLSLRRSVVGTSELAALVGMSPYDDFESVSQKKKEDLSFFIFNAGVLVGHNFRRRGR